MSNLEFYKNKQNFSPLAPAEISKQAQLLKHWDCPENKYLKRRYQCASYQEAKKFVDLIAEFAETVNHHPELLFGYKFVEVMIYTHDAGGLTKADFVYAQDIDNLYTKIN